MHTYIRNEDGTYTVGMWLPNRDGVTSFTRMFDAEDRYDAMTHVNILNGGGGSSGDEFACPKVTKEH